MIKLKINKIHKKSRKRITLPKEAPRKKNQS
jgi:hypothetical protein